MSFLLFLFFVTQTECYKPKLCVDCKYHIPDVFATEFSYCKRFPIKRSEDTYFLVTGIRSYPETHYMYCLTVRSSNFLLCGPNALLFSGKTNDT
jgi:hypothetical protein